MKLSARARYAVRILLDLAVHAEEAPVSTAVISGRTGITAQFVERLLKPLKRAGLVASKRGATGGYRLNRAPEKISLAEILRVMDGSLSLASCCEDDGCCVRAGNCLSREAWKRLNGVVVRSFESVSLGDVLTGVSPLSPGGGAEDRA